MKVMSFNVLCGRYEDRFDDVAAVIRKRMPDSFGLQEAHKAWMDAIVERMPEYDFVGVGRDDGKDAGEFSPVFYRRDMFTVVDSGNFWLNEKVTEPGKGWDAACVRICSYALLKNEETEEIYAHFNTHLDHVGPIAQKEGAKLIVAKIKELYPDVPVVLTGDFNVTPDSEAFKTFIDCGMTDTRDIAKKTDMRGTYHAFDKIEPVIIDYVLTNSPDAVVESFEVCHDRENGVIPSDHDAVIAEFKL